jgi:hypothetical protein
MRRSWSIIPVLVSLAALAACEQDVATTRLTAKPHFVAREDANFSDSFLSLMIEDSGQFFELPLGRVTDPQPLRLRLDTEVTYVFTIGERRDWPFKTSVLKIEHEDGLVYDVEMCQLHNAKMTLETVEIKYGLMMPSQDDIETAGASRRLFPNRREALYGGCGVNEDSPRRGKRYVCSSCEAAYSDWLAQRRQSR